MNDRKIVVTSKKCHPAMSAHERFRGQDAAMAFSNYLLEHLLQPLNAKAVKAGASELPHAVPWQVQASTCKPEHVLMEPILTAQWGKW